MCGGEKWLLTIQFTESPLLILEEAHLSQVGLKNIETKKKKVVYKNDPKWFVCSFLHLSFAS
jgi:hypothetical protein